MLAERLGPMATAVWAIYVKQVYVGVAQDLVMAPILAVLAYLSLRFGRYAGQRYEEDKAQNKYGNATGGWDMGIAAGYIAAVILALFALFLLIYAPWRLLNPEYYAIRMLLKPLK